MAGTNRIENRPSFIAMAATYCLGVFNDNYFKQAAMLLAVAASLNHLQGWAAMLFSLPFIIFSAHGGWCADRFSKKRMIILSKAVELGAMLIGAAGLITGNWPCILAMVFLMGLQSTFFSPALNGSIPEIFSTKSVPRVNAVLKLATTVAILAGIALAGFSLDLKYNTFAPSPGILVIAAVTVAVSLAGLAASLFIAHRQKASGQKPFPWLGPYNSIKDLVEISKDRELLLAISADAWFYFIASITILVINSLGIEQFRFSQTETSLLSVCLMLGICAGSLAAAKIVDLDRWSRSLQLSGLVMALGLILAGCSLFVADSFKLRWLALALTLAGTGGGLFLIPVTSFLQVRPESKEKGRVLAASGFSSFTAILLSGFLFNVGAQHLQPTSFMVLLSAAAFGAALLFGLFGSNFVDLNRLLATRLLRAVLALRYRVEVKGLDTIDTDDNRGILFLPNHPALIDPVIVMSVLIPGFSPRPLSDENQVDKPILRTLLKPVKPITIPDLAKNVKSGRKRVKEGLDKVVACLNEGNNILFYPSGRLLRTGREDLGANSGVEYILDNAPGIRIALVRTTGLWGSSFSHGSGSPPSLTGNIVNHLKSIVANGFFFAPKRRVTVEVCEDHRLAGCTGKTQINRCLEDYYNERTAPSIQVPYYWWQKSRPGVVAENVSPKRVAVPGNIAPSIQHLVTAKIEELAGIKAEGSFRLAQDLGLDSLSTMELSSWIENEYGATIDNPGALETVNDCILAAAGRLQHNSEAGNTQIPPEWFNDNKESLTCCHGLTIAEVFYRKAVTAPDRPIIADRIAGVKTYRDVLTGIFALRPLLQNLPGKSIGIMLPATTASAIVYLAALFSGKTPVLFNWTVGLKNLAHGIEQTRVSHIISSAQLCERIEEQQEIDLCSLGITWLHLEKIKDDIGLAEKAGAWLRARFYPQGLLRQPVGDTAAVLFTSGSESMPKAVPLTHANILANMNDFSKMVKLDNSHRLAGMLPPFHSLGLVGTIILPLCLGLKTVYHPNPTEPVILANIIDSYKASMLITTPTFLSNILQAGTTEQLSSINLVFTGAEKCPSRTRKALCAVNPDARLCEGYGITECSPLVSINVPEDPREGTIGALLPSIEYVLVDDDCTREVEEGGRGLLLVRGPSVFNGYLNQDKGNGFRRFNDKTWYQTGDYVRIEDGHLVFCGRRKRFIKIGGEMISLPAIEDALLNEMGIRHEAGPELAVEATGDESHPEIVLFSTRKLNRYEINDRLRRAGFSALHNIRRTITVTEIPVLGTGKTDYKLLKQLLA
ncbi:MFS transporter [Desulforhopalus singaporensis]|uniref:Acyl-CoA synthetase (AMP-forming)/AMP-acid ligase II n=1 Tax=Desulforhopalus singaporensis TaxID=91360 RepID=A0A1H0KNT4_9BACT|nr:MFS transporter [Desulforhopalus singaporensis]SDO57456.1 Acyl-CoA synthetase (AMP-forming)/AMP-acid ligase II [Desulforhopalus singaporensis]